MNFRQRTVSCGQLRPEDVGKHIVLNGWVNARRDYGSIAFIDLRDRDGVTQAVIDATTLPELAANLKDVRSEWVLWVSGLVRLRENPNPKIPTGLIEILVDEAGIINRSEVPPFEIVDDTQTNEELRLEYRYLDLRRPVLQQRLLLRSRLAHETRTFFASQGFVDVETPVLTRSTPEGARDYLVPSRMNKGRFYALPQSPQLFKQLLMVSGFDRYMQIVKVFRDEDLRADRQPEFTQIDVEMSFVDQIDVMNVAEQFVQHAWKTLLDIDLPTPFRRMTYQEAIDKYGSDKPDLRYELVISDVTAPASKSSFTLFSKAPDLGHVVKALRVPNGSQFSRKQLDELTEHARTHGAGGLPYLKVSNGEVSGSFAKQLAEGELTSILGACNAGADDLILFAVGEWERASLVLGALRIEVARRLGLQESSSTKYSILWITEFPLLEHDPEENRWVARHHPFTSPMSEDLHLLDSNPSAIRARAYDLVINGYEAAGGSIRIHDKSVQQRMFDLIGMSVEEANSKFGFLLKALTYGAPPHGGIAFGFDRLAMILNGTNNIRDVIAFPKTTSGLSLMDRCPSEVDDKQLKELGISLRS